VALSALASIPSTPAGRRGGSPVALVTAETENALLAVSLPDGRILRRVRLPADPENVAAGVQTPVVAVSTKGHAVTVLAWRSLNVVRIFRDFTSPHLAAISPDGEWAYVTDDATGTLTVIRLSTTKIVDRIFVGKGAHHLSFSPFAIEHQLWIALGEQARTIVVVDTAEPARPKVIGRFDPGFPAHDLAFSPLGTRVWITAANSNDVTVFSARTRRPLLRVTAGPPPQHVAFGEVSKDAYITSGYGSRVERVSPAGRVLRTLELPYGSFNVATSGGLVVISSLLRGTVTELTDGPMWRELTAKIAPAARDVAIAVW
jgi:DNA-binding beta-propeller fold protein YncE